jgi:hypothetical protein
LNASNMPNKQQPDDNIANFSMPCMFSLLSVQYNFSLQGRFGNYGNFSDLDY